MIVWQKMDFCVSCYMNTPPDIRIEISIPTFLFDKCREQPALLLDVLTEKQIAQINTFIFDNLNDKDGAPQVDDFNILSFTYNEEERRGSFRMHFYINRQFCCSDVESSRQDYVDFQFSYVNETLEATASYFNWDVL